MPQASLAQVNACLARDREWAAYAIGDLSPAAAPHCSWFVSVPEPTALVLLYRGFTPPILFALGNPDSLRPVIAELDAPVVSLQIRPDALPAIATAYTPANLKRMWRMALDPAAFQPAGTGRVEVDVLEESDLEAVARLYGDGKAANDGPTFFQPSMLGQGTFRGVREGDDLVAVAGTHMFSRDLGVCTVGNVYTRRDRRGRGLGAAVTSAVVSHAIDAGVRTIVLNVEQENHAARRVYERLGFHVHCPFIEGDAVATVAAQPRNEP
jgi:ribosomal protein S18 acetylase RimI-like enzyme